MQLTIESILAITKGECISSGYAYTPIIEGISIDSRAMSQHSLFVCIPGSFFDGHNFALQAVRSGAIAILANYNPFVGDIPVPVIIVPDTVKALGMLAQVAREKTQAKVIGVTGTAGKTTVKELIAQLLTTEGRVAKNYLNFNTQIGMSLSLLAAQGTEDFWVMEVGISESKDMDELGSILHPDVTLILNAGSGHVSGLGDKGVAYYKSQLLRYTKEDGVGFVSMDYSDLVQEAQRGSPAILHFSIKNKQAPFYGTYLGMSDKGQSMYRLWLNGEVLDVTTPFLGSIGAESVIASAAVAYTLGVSKERISQGFSQVILPKQRLNLSHVGPWLCIDDSYNANPLSMNKMITVAYELSEKRKPLVYVLGEMLELGNISEREHETIGYQLAQTGAAAIFWKGNKIENILIGLRNGNFTGYIQKVTTGEDLQKGIQNCGIDSGVILFKGSRSNQMELLVESFVTWVGIS